MKRTYLTNSVRVTAIVIVTITFPVMIIVSVIVSVILIVIVITTIFTCISNFVFQLCKSPIESALDP